MSIRSNPEETHPSPPRAWAEISLDALKHNINVAREASGQHVMAVLKAGAYGHDIKKISAALDNQGLTFYGVASVIEARKLTAIGCRTRIYLLGPTLAVERAEIAANHWTPSISSLAEAEHFNQLSNKEAPLLVHITIDTGMGRGGFLPNQLAQAIKAIQKLPNLSIEGIGSHLPSADEDEAFTNAQFQRFEDAVSTATQETNQTFKYIHLSNSAGLLEYSSTITNLVRPGLMLYGISPIQKHQAKLKPALTLKSRISIIRNLPKNHGISYGRSTILEKDSRIATIGIGYGDGYPRSLSHQGAEVWIRNTRCPILGRVTMDQIMVDVTDLPEATDGDEVELFGNHILASEVAEKADTIAWEIFTRITPRVTKIYV